jgi:hypothetical protein
MPLKVSYPDNVVGQGFIYKHVQTGAQFQGITLEILRNKVVAFVQANGFVLNNEEFEDNVCHNTPNCVCTEAIRGLGDIVHTVLNPIAKAIDYTTGSNLQGCGGCAQRQEGLNKLVPL